MDRLQKIEKLIVIREKLEKLLEQIDYKKLQAARAAKVQANMDRLNTAGTSRKTEKALDRLHKIKYRLDARQAREANRASMKRVGTELGKRDVAAGVKQIKGKDYAGTDIKLRRQVQYAKKRMGELMNKRDSLPKGPERDAVNAELSKVTQILNKTRRVRSKLTMRGARETARANVINTASKPAMSGVKSVGKIGKAGKIGAGVAAAGAVGAAGLTAFNRMKRRKEAAAKLANKGK